MADEGNGSATESESGQQNQQHENQHADLDKIAGLGDKGKEAIRKEREARAESERKLTEAAKHLQELETKASERADAQRKADEAAAAEAGKFEELATKREGERNAAKAEAATLKAENDQLRAAITEQVEASWKALPKEVQDVYPGASDDPHRALGPRG